MLVKRFCIDWGKSAGQVRSVLVGSSGQEDKESKHGGLPLPSGEMAGSVGRFTPLGIKGVNLSIINVLVGINILIVL